MPSNYWNKQYYRTLLFGKKSTPHCVIELSTREVKRIRPNTIHLGDLTFVNDKEDNTILSIYKNVVYGSGVKFKPKQFKELNSMKRYDCINLHQMTRNYIAITANKKYCIGNDVTTVPASYRHSSKDKGKKRVRKGETNNGHGSGLYCCSVVFYQIVIKVNQVKCFGMMRLQKSLSSPKITS